MSSFRMANELDPDVSDNERVVAGMTEKEIRTVEKFHRQLSSHSVLSVRTQDGLDEEDDPQAETISEEEADLLQQIINAFSQNQGDKTTDDIDGDKKYRRLSSHESHEFSLTGEISASFSRYVNPGRFYVRVTEETKAIVSEVHETIKRRKSRMTGSRINEGDITIRIVENQNVSQVFNVNSNEVNQPKTRGEHVSPGNGNATQASSFSNTTRNSIRLFTPLSQLPPRERFRTVVRKVINNQRKERQERRKAYKHRLWKKRGDVGWFDLIFTVIGIGAFFADGATDLKVASDHITSGHPWWGIFTVMFVVFPTMLVNIASYSFYIEDDKEMNRTPERGWKIVDITHLFQIGLMERYCRTLIKGYQIKFKKLRGSVEHYQLYIAMNLDTAMLQMILAFTEDAPQLVLQLYVLIQRRLVEKLRTESLQDWWTMASIFFSFISYSRAVVNYIYCLRASKEHKGLLRWYGYVSMWFWRVFLFTSRILVLVFFATEFHLWFFLVLFVHFGIVLALIWPQKVRFFPGQKVLQIFIRIVIAYIHTFCFFILEAAETIRWAVKYYSLIALEAIVFTTLWFVNDKHYLSLRLELAGMAVVFISFALGLLMMVVYYKFLHLKFKRPQTKWYTEAPPKEELCEDLEPDEASGADEEINSEDNTQTFDLARKRSTNFVKHIEVWV